MAFQFSKSNLPKQLFINNEFVKSKNPKKLSLYNPADGSLVADDVDLADENDVDAAVGAAEKALPAWKRLTNIARRDIMLKFASLIEQRGKELAELSRITLGAPYASFGAFETGMCAEAFKYNAGWIDKFAGESFPQDDGFLKIVRNEPLGVCAGIVPWNGPLGTVGLKAAPALATGNCFILKPSEKTPFASLALGPLIIEAGFPPGVFQVISGDGSTGALLASHMRVRKVSFTGSIPTGKRIQEMAAKSNLKRVTLELGGKSPAVVFDDANLDNAVTWLANAITANTGQVCFAASRVYVQEGIYGKFVSAYKKALQEKTKTIGDPEADGTVMGPLIDKAQFDRVSGFISRGQSENQGTLLTGGQRVGSQGFFIEPTVFENVRPDAEIITQEIFGPVAVLNSFKTEEEIIEKSNNTNFGLMAGVFTENVNRALRVASAFDSGMVGVNCVSLMMMQTPFGGTKESGVGRECGKDALLAFTDRKTVMVNMNY
ncbi:aldehyde dehydrogenase domain-containing protein [Amylocarpus encephaloides]|uniref:aldehyde dehydrogenase (NAD(+)) n=1 Tax=Amylocarpus encephaloides TaxID=45428 RepID=A0A9P7YL55_9HELO|nr:aldehyde dehydrogenase domain-containing protein [Amylocarpus encephaloides]